MIEFSVDIILLTFAGKGFPADSHISIAIFSSVSFHTHTKPY